MNRIPGMFQVEINERHARGVAEKAVVPFKYNLPNLTAALEGESSGSGSHSRRESPDAHLSPQRGEGGGGDFKWFPGKDLFAYQDVELQFDLAGLAGQRTCPAAGRIDLLFGSRPFHSLSKGARADTSIHGAEAFRTREGSVPFLGWRRTLGGDGTTGG